MFLKPLRFSKHINFIIKFCHVEYQLSIWFTDTVHGLKTSLLVCDGGALNLAALKATHGCFGAYGINTDTMQDHHVVKPWFTNPLNPLN